LDVEIPTDIFSYDEETKTLRHLTSPVYEIILRYTDSLVWCTEELEYFKAYLLKENLVPQSFVFCTGPDRWYQDFYPIEYTFSYSTENTNMLIKFDPLNFKVRYHSKGNRLELYNVSNNEILYTFKMYLSENKLLIFN